MLSYWYLKFWGVTGCDKKIPVETKHLIVNTEEKMIWGNALILTIEIHRDQREEDLRTSLPLVDDTEEDFKHRSGSGAVGDISMAFGIFSCNYFTRRKAIRTAEPDQESKLCHILLQI